MRNEGPREDREDVVESVSYMSPCRSTESLIVLLREFVSGDLDASLLGPSWFADIAGGGRFSEPDYVVVSDLTWDIENFVEDPTLREEEEEEDINEEQLRKIAEQGIASLTNLGK